MTSVNITTTKNTVTVTEGDPTIVTVSTQGPAGPQGPTGASFSLTDADKVDTSVIYYDSTAGVFKADATWTASTLVDGSNF